MQMRRPAEEPFVSRVAVSAGAKRDELFFFLSLFFFFFFFFELIILALSFVRRCMAFDEMRAEA